MSTGQPYHDIELLRRIADGDEAAFSEFFRLYFDPLYQTIFRFTNKHIDTEDIVQAVFIKAWEKRSVFREMENPMNWFFIAARNEYFDRFRKIRQTRQYQQYLLEAFNEPDISPETILANKEYTNIYYQAVRNLPEKQQQAYLLSREKGLTYDEIAVEMKIEKSTVKEHIARAIRSIKAFFLSHTNPGTEFIFFLFFLKLLSAAFLACASFI